MKKQKRKSWLC